VGPKLNQFLRFCVVGAIGFAIDAGILQALVVGVQANPYAARIASFLVAASATWLMNRTYTFSARHRATRTEWLRYVALMTLGALINYGAFALCIATSTDMREQPWLAVAVGSIAGLGVNFATSRLLFRARQFGHDIHPPS
jgi:putative flippase GtrA